MVDIYQNDFEKFLAHTDEKATLLTEIGQDLEIFGVKSVLDIGAGNGLLSIPLSKKVSDYTAVEKNPNFAALLRKAKLNVIEATFPTDMPSTYDLVLASHSISYKPENFRPFVEAAWNCVARGGRLLIITYRGREDDWTSLMGKIGQPSSDYNRVGYDGLVKVLSSLGEVTIRTVTTTVQTETVGDMIEALSFVASNGMSERKARFLQETTLLTEILNNKYHAGNGYTFPFQHYFLTTKKNQT